MGKLLFNSKTFSLLFFVILFTTQSEAGNDVPKPGHLMVVILENHSYLDIIGSASAPHINALLTDTDAALFTASYAIQHPSQPNYLDLFSGSDQGITSDDVPSNTPFSTANLAAQLITASCTYTTYSEGLPNVGYNGKTSGEYARKHNPAANWMGTGTNRIPTSSNQPLTALPSSSNFASLPTVCYVIPNLDDDMHNGTIQEADNWVYNNLTSYIQWAKAHNSLLMITFDEDDSSAENRIPTIFVGQMVKGGQYSEHVTHYSFLRTIEDMYNLPYAGSAASATTITDCWKEAQIATGMENTSNESFSVKVFPNPTSSNIIFSINNYPSSDAAFLTVVDMLGQIEEKLPLKQTPVVKMNTSSFANGSYYYYITQNNKTLKSGKFIVAH